MCVKMPDVIQWEKGKVIHVCTKNPNSSYKLMGSELAVINEEGGFANIIMLLYQSRMHLKYCVQFWSAHFRKNDLREFEKFQVSVLSFPIRQSEQFSCKKILWYLGLLSLERRQMRGSMIKVYKIKHGGHKVDKKKVVFPFPKY